MTDTTNSSNTSQTAKQLLLYNNLRNLNDVFEFAKNDRNSKYLAENISKNFSTKRIKLKELMDEVVIMQKESNHLEQQPYLEQFNQNDSQIANNANKKTLMDLLSTPSQNIQQTNFTLPSLCTTSQTEHITDSNKAASSVISNNLLKLNHKPDLYNDTTTVKRLKDIIDLIQLNNHSDKNTIDTNSRLFKSLIKFKFNSNDSDEIVVNDYSNQKAFITELDEKEQLLSNNMNRNMELLQNCLKAKYISQNTIDKPQENKKYPFRLIKMSSAPIMSSSDTNSMNQNDSDDSEIKTKKKLNFYSIGHFDSVLNTKEDESVNMSNESLDESDETSQKVILLEEQQTSSNKGKYSCLICGLKTKKPSMLKMHMRSHENLRPFLCSWCNISFKTKGNLVKHMKTQVHFKKCLELGLNANDEEITRVSSKNIDSDALSEQMIKTNNNVSIFNE